MAKLEFWAPRSNPKTDRNCSARACSTLNLRTGIAFCPSWMRRSYASRRALDETGAADRDMPPQGQDPAPGSAAHDFGHCLAASERGQVAPFLLTWGPGRVLPRPSSAGRA